jgi:hypothetical protein
LSYLCVFIMPSLKIPFTKCGTCPYFVSLLPSLLSVSQPPLRVTLLLAQFNILLMSFMLFQFQFPWVVEFSLFLSFSHIFQCYDFFFVFLLTNCIKFVTKYLIVCSFRSSTS